MLSAMKLEQAVRGQSTNRICGDFWFYRMVGSLVESWLQSLSFEEKPKSY